MKIFAFFLFLTFYCSFSANPSQKKYTFMNSPSYSMAYDYTDSKIRIDLEFQTNGYVGIGFGSQKMTNGSDKYNTSCHIMYYKNESAYLMNGYCKEGQFFPDPNDNSASLLAFENRIIENLVNTSTFFPKMRKFTFERILNPPGLFPIKVNEDVPMIWSTGKTDDFRETHFFEQGLVFNFNSGVKTSTSFRNKTTFWICLILMSLLLLI